MAEKCVTQTGFVEKIDGSKVFVRILALAACVGCHGEKNCSSADKAEKMIEGETDEKLSIGDPVIVTMSQRLGKMAVRWMLIYPTIVLTLVMALLSIWFRSHPATFGEVLTAGVSLLSVFLYFGTLILFRDRLSKEFIFRVRLNQNRQGD